MIISDKRQMHCFSYKMHSFKDISGFSGYALGFLHSYHIIRTIL